MYGSGLRALESLRLRIGDLDMSRRTIRVHAGKGGKDRVMVLPDRLVGRTVLTGHDLSCYVVRMAKIKISSKVEQREWEALQALAAESNQSISGLLSEAVAEYVRKRRLRPQVMAHLDDSMTENEELGKLLAQ